MSFWDAWPAEVPPELFRMPPRLRGEYMLGALFMLNLIWLAFRTWKARRR